MDPRARYEEKKQRLMKEMAASMSGVELGKDTSNLFRDTAKQQATINVRDFQDVLEVNTEEQWVECEGMVTYERLVDATLPLGVAPAVVPELKSITVGGAVSGTGLESSSFRHGFMHETVLEMDVLLADGRVVTASPENEYKDLFFGLPNSYGTLGFILRLKVRTIPAKKYVQVSHRRFTDVQEFFEALKAETLEADNDFVEGVVFSPEEYVVSTGRFTDNAPYASDYTYMKIYYRSLLKRDKDYLSAHDYLWRWDTDWFWVSRVVFAQNPVVRFLLGSKRLNSVFYTNVMRWNAKLGLVAAVKRLLGNQHEAVIQDIEVPVDNAPAFLEFLHKEIGLRPIIVGPVTGSPTGQARFPLFPLDPGTLYVNIGFWGTVRVPKGSPPGMLNKKIEAEAMRLKAFKMLYSDSFFSEEDFYRQYGGEAYRALKAKYDPHGKLKGLYEKCVLKG